MLNGNLELYFLINMCVHYGQCTCYGVIVEVRGPICGASSLYTFMWVCGLSSLHDKCLYPLSYLTVLFVCFETVLLCNPGWLQICHHYSSAFPVLGLQACATVHNHRVLQKIS